MADDLSPLRDYLDGLIRAASPNNIRKLSLRLARDMRIANSKRIKKNVEPDGGAMAPRHPKPQRRGSPKQKKAMFAKIGAARNMKVRGDVDEASVAFRGLVAHTAFVHHHGLRDRIEKKRPYTAQYTPRKLLGFSDGDEDIILKRIEDHFAAANGTR